MDKIINLLAFLLPIGIFAYSGIIGYAAVSLLRSQRNTLQNLLLSPSVGIAITLLPVLWLNRAGLPINSFAIPLTFFLLLISIAILLIRKPVFPFKHYKLFAYIFLLALFLTGRPLLHFGFNWVSYANDDMANYCLGALRFLNHGYSEIPNPTDIIQGKDLSQYYWFTYNPGMVRSGNELLLAWLSGLTKLNPIQIFMPLILAFHLILISSMGAMVLVSRKWKTTALITCLFLTCSALTTLGTLYQLIAQVIGLSFLITVGTLLFQLFNPAQKQYLLRSSILLSITACASLIVYLEVSPMLGLAFILYFIISVINGWKPTKAFFIILILTALISLVFLNKYLINVIAYLQYQATIGLVENKGALFPYFLIPSGIANLWGMQTVAVLPDEPWLSTSIFLGYGLSILTLFLLIKQIPKRYPPSIITAVMIGFSLYLITKLKLHSGFSLFKLAMYIQPFLFAVLAFGIFEKISSKKLKILAIFIVIGLGLHSQFSYLQYSYGYIGTPFNELPSASAYHLPSELTKVKKELPSQSTIISDTANIVSTKLQSLSLSGNKTFFYSDSFFDKFIFMGLTIFKQSYPDMYLAAKSLKKSIENTEFKLPFPLGETSKIGVASYFNKSHFETTDNAILIMDTPLRSIFNRHKFSHINTENYVAQPIRDVSNHLVFINSSLGQYYYFGDNAYISLYNLERDYFYPENTMAGIGRYLLFRVINPSKKFRLELNISNSLTSDSNNQLPHPEIIGDKHYSMPFIGRGSARVFSSEFTPRTIQNASYFMLDMRNNGKVFPSIRRGLMHLYGNDISLDTRLLVSFARDMSLVSEDEYNHLNAPCNLKNFPEDLKNPKLEYSGIYEDGWFSEDVFMKLSQPNQQSKLLITGMLPTFQKQINSTLLTVYIDNKKLAEQKIQKGTFQLAINVPGNNVKRNIRLHFSDYFFLPKGDGRPVAVKMNYIGFKTT